MSNIKTEKAVEQRITVKTPKGDIIVRIKHDTEYVGVDVDLINNNGKEEALAMIEYEPDKDKIQAVIYSNTNDEPSHIIPYDNGIYESKLRR